jgi:hypothetical protein
MQATTTWLQNSTFKIMLSFNNVFLIRFKIFVKVVKKESLVNEQISTNYCTAEVTKQSILIYRLIAASCLVDRCRLLVSVKINLPPHYNQ